MGKDSSWPIELLQFIENQPFVIDQLAKFTLRSVFFQKNGTFTVCLPINTEHSTSIHPYQPAAFMLLTLTTTHHPATDLGFLLGKHPGRHQTTELNAGVAHIFYPQATETCCTAALLLEIDPVALVRKSDGNDAFALDQYVNDRPYIASSLMSNAIAKCFGSALNGNCKDRPELVETALPLEARVAIVSARGGENMLRRLFEPLGYVLELTHHPLDEAYPEWGESRYFTLTLRHTIRLSDLLSHLYVLMPVLDNEKHYYVAKNESEKLLEKGGAWLPKHPERELITRRYLKNKSHLTRPTLEILLKDDPEMEQEDNLEVEKTGQGQESEVAKPRLHDVRLEAALAELLASGARTVLDLGCGEGRLLKLLLEKKQFTHIVGMDVAHRTLEIAARRLRIDRLPSQQQDRLKLIHGSLLYRDKRLEGFDAAALVEVIEHLDAPRLATFERVVFGYAHPRTVVVTTPNAEYNAVYGMEEGNMRHDDHRFEWTRAEFAQWAAQTAEKFGYAVRIEGLGALEGNLGTPSQMAVFTVLNV